MPVLKTIDTLFKDLGYSSDYTPSKEINLLDDDDDKSLFEQTKQSLGQTIDIILPKPTLGVQSTPFRQLVDILGTRYIARDLTTSNYNNDSNSNDGSHHYNNNNNSISKTTIEHKYKHNDQLRMDVIDEFLSTEENYLRKLQALVETIVKPLKHSCTHDKHPILNKFMCTNIFLNLEQILELHQHFMKELKARKGDFATICSTNTGKMDRYRRYLLKVNDAHELHSTEYQKNQTYRSFIIKTITNPVFEKLSLKDLLDQPWKRITAYTLLLKDIRNHTSSDHPDFTPLTDAFTQINTIASVRDDVPTILATKSHDLYVSIRKAPCHLIKQSRSLITHLDAVEINRNTGKVYRHVTIFLFCDKIMVASRSSQAKGADICDGITTGANSPLTNNLMHKKKKANDFKFCGWVGLEHIDLFHGPSDLPGAIIIRASSDFQDSITEMGYEKYFQKGTRIFAYQTEPARQTLPRFMKDKDTFVDTFYKTQAVARQYGNQDATYHRSWNDINVYSNVYDYETYTKTEIKNNVAAILLEKESEIDIPALLTSIRSSPWIVALVRPDSQGLKLNIWTRVPLSCLHDQQQQQCPTLPSSSGSTTDEKKQLDFATVFWNNIIKCEKKLRCSSTYRLMNESLEEQDMQRPPRSRSRTSMSRSTSVSNISKFFRSRSQSPSASLSSQVVPTSSRSTPSQQQQQQENDDPSRQRRQRSHSMSNDPTASDTKTKTPTTRRRKLSFDASFFKIDIKSPNTNNTVSSSSSSSLSSRTSTATIQQQSSKLLQPKRSSPPPPHQPSIRHSSYSPNRQQSISPVATTPIPVPSTSCSPPPMMHPTELPSPSMYLPSRQNGHASYSPPPMSTDPGKQRQLIEKLDAMYHDMTGTGRTSTKEHQSRHTSDPLMARPPSRSCTGSPTSPVSMNLSSFAPPYHHQSMSGNFGTSSSRSSSYTNTFSSHASQSSRSSFSLEEMDPFKGYAPSPRLVNTDMVNSPNNLHHPHEDDDEITRKVMSDLANGHKKWATQKSLMSHYTSAIEVKKQQHHPHHHHHQTPSPSPPPLSTFNGNVTPTATMSMPALMMSMEKEPALDHVATAVDHCSYQVGSKWQFLMDKQRMLGNQVSRVSDRLPFKDADVDMLNEVYRDTMDETSNFFNKINSELKEIATIVNAYRQGYQQHQQRRNSSIDTPTTPTTSTPLTLMNAHDADALLKRKLKEAQLERDYWHRRASELTNQVNEYVLKQ